MKKGCIGCLVFILILLVPIAAVIYRVFQADEVQDAMAGLEENPIITEDYHRLRGSTTEFADGSIHQAEYLFSSDPSEYLKDSIGCVYYENGQEVRREEYTRDRLQNIISISDGNSETTFALTYDDRDRIIERIISVDGTQTETQTCRYEGELLAETVRTQNGVSIGRTVIEYDDQNRRTKITHYDGADQITGYVLCSYDEKISLETLQQYDAAGNMLGYLEITYSSRMLPVVEKSYDADGDLISKTQRDITTGTVTYTQESGNPIYN